MKCIDAIVAFFAFVFVVASAVEVNTYYVYSTPGPVSYDANGIPNITFVYSTTVNMPNRILMASVVYASTYMEIGWDQVKITGSQSLLNSSNTAGQAWYAAGAAEGYASFQQITNFYISQNYTYTSATANWISIHIQYMRTNAIAKGAESPFWRQVSNQLLQMTGISVGYNARAKELGRSERLSFDDVFKYNIQDEYPDILGSTTTSTLQTKRTLKDQHCSSLIKITNDDAFFAHDTWAGFSLLVARQYKTYEMDINVSMSSNAGIIASGDDWYMTSNKLAVMETTNEFTNNSLYKLIKPQCVSEFMRVMVGTYLAQNGNEWVNFFKTEPSGTYCNQWMVFDYKLYTKGMKAANLPNNTFWLAEEIPGLIESADMTAFIRTNGYWASYNIPYFPNIYTISGFAFLAQTVGTFFSWSENFRAKIFRRDNVKVTNLVSMQNMMRYNNFQTDPFSIISNCSGCNPKYSPLLSVASRSDLVNPNAVFNGIPVSYASYFYRKPFGAIDSKIASNDMLTKDFSASAVMGPTTENQVPFSWSEFPGNPLGMLAGMLQTYDFSFVHISSNTIPTNPNSKNNKWSAALTIGLIVGLVVFIVFIGVAIYAYRQRDNSAEYHSVA